MKMKICFCMILFVVACLQINLSIAQDTANDDKTAVQPSSGIGQLDGDPAFRGVRDPLGFDNMKGALLPVRGTKTSTFENAKRMPLEVYRDNDFGNLAYISESGSISVAPYRKTFELRTMRTSAGFDACRFCPANGKAWILGTDGWVMINEPNSKGPGPGDYDVKMFGMGKQTDKDEAWGIFRLDQRNGTTWMLKKGNWQLIAEATQTSEADPDDGE